VLFVLREVSKPDDKDESIHEYTNCKTFLCIISEVKDSVEVNISITMPYNLFECLLLNIGWTPAHRVKLHLRVTWGILAKTQYLFFSLAPKFFLIEEAQKYMKKYQIFLGPDGRRYAEKTVSAHFCRSLEKFLLRINLFTLYLRQY
jgi:hypothetical protein